MFTREQHLEAALRGIIDSFELCRSELHSAKLDQGTRFIIRAAIQEAKNTLYRKKETVPTKRVYGKRREGQDRSALAHPGLSTDSSSTPEE